MDNDPELPGTPLDFILKTGVVFAVFYSSITTVGYSNKLQVLVRR